MTKQKLVPVEPTEEMLDAAKNIYNGGPYNVGIGKDKAREIYKAMLAAAPASETKAWSCDSDLWNIFSSWHSKQFGWTPRPAADSEARQFDKNIAWKAFKFAYTLAAGPASETNDNEIVAAELKVDFETEKMMHEHLYNKLKAAKEKADAERDAAMNALDSRIPRLSDRRVYDTNHGYNRKPDRRQNNAETQGGDASSTSTRQGTHGVDQSPASAAAPYDDDTAIKVREHPELSGLRLESCQSGTNIIAELPAAPSKLPLSKRPACHWHGMVCCPICDKESLEFKFPDSEQIETFRVLMRAWCARRFIKLGEAICDQALMAIKLEKQVDDFCMDYRLKCDAETKRLEQRVVEQDAVKAELSGEIAGLRHDIARSVQRNSDLLAENAELKARMK